MKPKRRTRIRIILFLAAAIVLLLARNIRLMDQNRRREILIQNSYARALEDLSAAADNINNTLEKQLCSGTSRQQEILANKLFNEASTAKQSISRLPMKEMSLENTYKFLSQVGSYAKALADKTADGGLKEEDYKNLKQLKDYAQKLSDRAWELERAVSSGEISISSVSDSDMSNDVPDITEGFTEFEKGFSSYPTLIYDGPFSDHIMQKEPLMTKNAEPISKTKALERACSVLNISSNVLTDITEQEGKLPCRVFSDRENTVSCAVTKQGGYISYFIKNVQPQSAKLTVEEAVEIAKKFVEDNGFKNMKVTYFERLQNTVTVNLAYSIDDVTCYTDLMKVSVSLEDGDVLGWDSMGYLVNHRKRSFPEKVISVKECAKLLSPYLECKSSGKALIPTEGGGEAYCYEYRCKTEDDRNILVYINARTAREEQILILLESEDGTLAM